MPSPTAVVLAGHFDFTATSRRLRLHRPREVLEVVHQEHGGRLRGMHLDIWGVELKRLLDAAPTFPDTSQGWQAQIVRASFRGYGNRALHLEAFRLFA